MGLLSGVIDPNAETLALFSPTQAQVTQQQSQFIGTPGTPGTGGTSNGASPISSFLNQALLHPLESTITGINSLFGTTIPGGVSTAAGGQSGLQSIASSASAVSSSLISALFLRSIVVITGFIFVAEGLSMFKGNPSIISSTLRKVK